MSARIAVAAALRAAAPGTWTVLDDAPPAVDRLDVGRVLAYVTPDTVTPGPYPRSWRYGLDVTILVGHSTPAAADDALDDALVHVVGVLDAFANVDEWSADRVVILDQWHGVVVRFAMLATAPTTP